MSEEMEIARQWLAKARSDLLNADNNLAAKEIPYDTVCFHCQQAAEKLLKAYLLGNGLIPPLTHDLLLVLEKIMPLNNEAEKLRDTLAILMPYAVEIRYPDGWFMPTEADAREARKAADQVLKWLEDAFPAIVQQNPQDE